MLYEITKLHIYINKVEDTNILCHNSAIAIRSDRGLHILDVPHNLRCYDKKLDYVETLIIAPKYSPVTELFEDTFVKDGIRNSEFIQMVLDPTLWPHNNQLLNEMTSISAFKWSPIGFIGNMDSVIAVLTNVGCVELFGPSRLKWVSVLNLSSLVKENLKRLSLTNTLDITPRNSKELQEAAHVLATTAICWPEKINTNGSCYFVTAQKSGLILFWLLKYHDLEIKGEVLSHIDADPTEILYITWIPITDDTFLLIKSNILGNVIIYVCIIENNVFKCLKKDNVWTYNDRMIARHFNYVVDDVNIILFYSKHRHFVTQVFDKNCNLKSQEVTNINDYRITDIKKLNNAFYLATVNNKLYKIELQYNPFKVQRSLVEIKESYPTSELHAIGFSTNGALCTLALIERKVLWRKEPSKIDLIFLKNSNDHECEIAALINNPTKLLTNYWDYIEMLRYTIIKTKMLPDLDYNQLMVEGDTDIYQLKVYYILLMLYKNLDDICKNASKGLLPETSLEVISEKIQMCYACNLIKKLYEKYQFSDCNLTGLESETLSSAKSYLDYYCDKYKMDLNTLVDPHILDIIKTEHKYICQCCDEEINGFSCRNGHLNIFCSLTFTPIENIDYLVCKACGALARSELMPSKPTCVFCDLYLYESFTVL